MWFSLTVLSSCLVMPYMYTDLSKVRGPLTDDKVQYLVYQMLCGLRVRPTSKPPPSLSLRNDPLASEHLWCF